MAVGIYLKMGHRCNIPYFVVKILLTYKTAFPILTPTKRKLLSINNYNSRPGYQGALSSFRYPYAGEGGNYPRFASGSIRRSCRGEPLLREGLDIPEVSLVAILDADKEGFLRSERSLIQTSGRAARNVAGKVIMYADKITKSIQACLDETKRRRIIQLKYNEDNNITPESIKKTISNVLGSIYEADYVTVPSGVNERLGPLKEEDLPALIAKLTKEMKQAEKNMEFEHAAELRDELKELNKILLEMG